MFGRRHRRPATKGETLFVGVFMTAIGGFLSFAMLSIEPDPSAPAILITEDLEMPLRHGNGPAPAWAAGCAGPFLIIMCALGLLGFVFAGVHSFQYGAAVAAMVVLGAAGIWLTVDYFGERFRRGGK